MRRRRPALARDAGASLMALALVLGLGLGLGTLALARIEVGMTFPVTVVLAGLLAGIPAGRDQRFPRWRSLVQCFTLCGT